MKENNKIELTRAECYRKLKKKLWLGVELLIFVSVPLVVVLAILTVWKLIVGIAAIALTALVLVLALPRVCGNFARVERGEFDIVEDTLLYKDRSVSGHGRHRHVFLTYSFTEHGSYREEQLNYQQGQDFATAQIGDVYYLVIIRGKDDRPQLIFSTRHTAWLGR